MNRYVIKNIAYVLWSAQKHVRKFIQIALSFTNATLIQLKNRVFFKSQKLLNLLDFVAFQLRQSFFKNLRHVNQISRICLKQMGFVRTGWSGFRVQLQGEDRGHLIGLRS